MPTTADSANKHDELIVRHAELRDFKGYGAEPPNPKWPGGARVALSFVLNLEEGGENTILNGDPCSETFLNETPGGMARPTRDIAMESQYEYGSRCGFWRIMRLFKAHDIPMTIHGVGRSLELNPELARACEDAGHEMCSHGYRWINYGTVSLEEERDHVQRSIAAQTRICGSRPLGWYTGRCSDNTLKLVAEEGGFEYCSDSYADDLPYWTTIEGKPLLMLPYTLDNNDMKWCVPPGISSGDDFFNYLKDSFDVLYEEGETAPKMMSIGLHCRLVGRPGRAASLARFLKYVASHDHVWCARRIDIARHWKEHFPYTAPPS